MAAPARPASARPAAGSGEAADGPDWANRALQKVLTPTFWFDPGADGEPFRATVWFSGRRAGVTGKPKPGDTFTRLLPGWSAKARSGDTRRCNSAINRLASQGRQAVGKASRRKKTGSTRERIAAQRAAQRAAERRRRIVWFSAGGLACAAIIAAVAVAVTQRSAASEVIPPGVGGGTPSVQPSALVVPNTSGIRGVVAYDTTGWPSSSNNGPANRALGHTHVPGPVKYSVTPSVGGDHNPTWMNCGVYDKPVPTERAVHNLEHGAVWITYRPSLPRAEVDQLRALFSRQTVVANTGSRYVDLTPYPGLPAPVVVSAWGFQLRLTSPTDPRLQQFVNSFRYSRRYSPEYGGACTGGVGTPLQN